VALSAEVEGAVSQLSVRDNDAVAKDAPLFTIDPTPYRLQVEESSAAQGQAEANLALARPHHSEMQALLDAARAVEADARANFARVQTLTRQEVASAAQLDDATRDMDSAVAKTLAAQAAHNVAAQSVAVMSANLQAARAALARDLPARQDRRVRAAVGTGGALRRAQRRLSAGRHAGDGDRDGVDARVLIWF
jgi:multidrug resistance efflux pump